MEEVWYVSNAGPGKHVTSGDGRVVLEWAPGGLALLLAPSVSRLARVRDVHWVAAAQTPEDRRMGSYWYPNWGEARVELVDVGESLYKRYYGDFANTVLWLILHGRRPGLGEKRLRRAWEAYKKVNAMFAKVVIERAGKGATVIVHDYQMALCPAIIKRARPDLKVVGYWHIPFSGVEELRESLPIDIAQEFLRDMGRVRWGYHSERWALCWKECYTSLVGEVPSEGEPYVVPGYIDVDALRQQARRVGEDRREEMLHRLGLWGKEGMKYLDRDPKERRQIIVTVGRADPKNGVLRILYAYQRLLKDITLEHKPAMILVTSRTRPGVATYDRYWEKVVSMATHIKLEGGRLSVFEGAPYETTLAALQVADVAVFPSERGGRDLVALEPVCVREDDDRPVVVVVGSGAAVAETLEGAVVVQNIESGVNLGESSKKLFASVREVLEMSSAERESRMALMRKSVSEENPVEWAEKIEEVARNS